MECQSRALIDGKYSYMRFLTAFDIITDCLSKYCRSFSLRNVSFVDKPLIKIRPAVVVLSANIILRARIQWRKKVILGLICSLTVIMVVIAIIRIAVWSRGLVSDLSWLMLFNSVEMTIGNETLLPSLASPSPLFTSDSP